MGRALPPILARRVSPGRLCLATVIAFAAVLSAGIGGGGTDSAFAGQDSNASSGLSLDAVRGRVLEVHDSIASVELTYLAAPRNARADVPRLYSQHHVAQKGRLRFAENTHFTDEVGVDLDLNHTRQFFTGDSFDVFYVKTRYYETSRRNAKMDYPWKLRVDAYLTAVGWWPKDDDLPPDDLARNPYPPLRKILQDPTCVLLERSENVDGHHCVVLFRPKRDKTWLAPDLAYAVCRREILDPRRGEPWVRTTPSSFRRYPLAGGLDVWFPMQVDGEELPLASKGREEEKDGPPRPSWSASLHLKALQLNSVSDTVFRFVAPPGTLIQDRDTLQVSQVSGGLDLLDESVDMARKIQQYNPRRARTSAPSMRIVDLLGLLIVGFVLVPSLLLAGLKVGRFLPPKATPASRTATCEEKA